MSQFAVYDRDGELHAVKAGFSWPAFLFSGVWAFWKQMPGHGIALLGAALGPLALGESGEAGAIGHAIGHFAPLVVALCAGSLGNSWWRSALQGEGFEQLGAIDAESPEEALLVWKDEALLADPAPERLSAETDPND